VVWVCGRLCIGEGKGGWRRGRGGGEPGGRCRRCVFTGLHALPAGMPGGRASKCVEIVALAAWCVFLCFRCLGCAASRLQCGFRLAEVVWCVCVLCFVIVFVALLLLRRGLCFYRLARPAPRHAGGQGEQMCGNCCFSCLVCFLYIFVVLVARPRVCNVGLGWQRVCGVCFVLSLFSLRCSCCGGGCVYTALHALPPGMPGGRANECVEIVALAAWCIFLMFSLSWLRGLEFALRV
jgi:hypothetical protein